MTDLIEFKDFGRTKTTIAFGGYVSSISYSSVVITVSLCDEETYKLFEQYIEDVYNDYNQSLWNATCKFDVTIKRTLHVDSLIGCWLQKVDRDDKEITLKLVFDGWNKIDNDSESWLIR